MSEQLKMTDNELQEELVGVLTAISIVSKRLANRLLKLDGEIEREVKEKHE